MSAIATAEPIARKGAVGITDFTTSKAGTGIPRTRPTQPERLTPEERDRLWAASKDYDDFTEKAIAGGKLVGDFTIDRHIRPQRTHAEIVADILRIQAENPELYKTPEQIRNGA